MLRFIPIVLASLIVFGCTPPEAPDPVPDDIEPTSVIDVSPEGIMAEHTELDIGDVEQTIHFNITLAPGSRARNIQVDSRSDALNRIRLTTVTIEPPFPDELVFDVTLQCRNQFGTTPVVLRGQYVVNDEPVADIRYVLGENSHRDHPLGKVEVMQALDTLPDSALFSLDVEALLMPRGTDPESLDPEEASTSPERRSTAITFNPVRIEFVGMEAEAEPVVDDDTIEEDADAYGEEAG